MQDLKELLIKKIVKNRIDNLSENECDKFLRHVALINDCNVLCSCNNDEYERGEEEGRWSVRLVPNNMFNVFGPMCYAPTLHEAKLLLITYFLYYITLGIALNGQIITYDEPTA